VATNSFFKKTIKIIKKKSSKKKVYNFKYDNFKMKEYLGKINLDYKKDINDFLCKI
jgi:hypothetical protein